MPTPRKNTSSTQKGTNLQPKSAAAKKSPAKVNEPITEVATQDRAAHPIVVPLKSTPDWSDWSRRHTISLFKAICLAHNITPNRKTFESLRMKKDARTIKFQAHLNTLRDNVRHDPALIVEVPESKTKLTEGTKITIQSFIDWVKKADPFPDLSMPSEFLEITPLISAAIASPNVKTMVSEGAVVIKNTDAMTGDVHGSEKPNKAWARVMVALAVKHYNFVPVWPTSELSKSKKVTGLYMPVARLCKEYGLDGATTRDTVRAAFISALDKLGEKAVKELIIAINKSKKTTR